MTFIEACLAGQIKNPAEEIDDWVDRWHKGSSKQSLHEFLGMTMREYGLWLGDGSPVTLEVIISGRKLNSQRA